jgi:hypothetical protein
MPRFLDHIAFRDIRALDAIAKVVHHLGDAGHADAADADEVDRADVGADAFHSVGLPLRVCFGKLGTSGRSARLKTLPRSD